jgi:hypothetical protein
MISLADLQKQRDALRAQVAERTAAHEKFLAEAKDKRAAIEAAEALALAGIDYERIAAGLAVVYIYGDDYRRVGGESWSVIADAKSEIAAGGGKLRREYFGVKNYAQWTGQRSDHGYGWGPSHGSTVFAIGLRDPRAPLTPQRIEDALYVLAHIDAVLDSRAVAGKVRAAS